MYYHELLELKQTLLDKILGLGLVISSLISKMKHSIGRDELKVGLTFNYPSLWFWQVVLQQETATALELL